METSLTRVHEPGVRWVADFSVHRYDDELRRFDARIRRDGSFVAHSTRHLIEARR